MDRNQKYSGSPMKMFDPEDGVLLVDKPSGPTSHDVVDVLRRQFKFLKAGHGGTLDPQATGLLVILTGRGTKLSERFMSGDKIYEGTLKLGVSTDSYDAQGKVLREADFSAITKEQVEAEMRKRTGDMMQTPPMVSAVKVAGVPLYKMARKGKVVEREARLIHVYEFTLDHFELPRADFTLRCTKGTYVRSLCHDIGEALLCGGHLEKLRRTQSGNFKLEDAMELEEILKMTREQVLGRIIQMKDLAMRELSAGTR